MRKKRDEIENQLRQLDVQQKKVGDQSEAIRTELVQFAEQAKNLENELAQSTAVLERFRTAFRTRAIANYKMLSQASGVGFLVEAASPTDLLRRTVYLSRISQHDEQGVTQMRQQIAVVEKEQGELDRLKKKRSAQLEALTGLERQLQENERQQQTLLAKKEAEAKGHESSLVKLRTNELELERMLEVLTGGEPAETVPVAVPTPAVPPGIQEIPAVTPVPIRIRPIPFSGPGLENLRGNLLFPVSGRLIQAFGMQRHEEFSELLFHKGIEMEVSQTVPVQVIAAGKVVVEQDLPGIGLTVIVDHGSRYYSLYGRLRVVTRQPGDELKRGESIGQAGPPDPQGRNFYFELRYRGKAVDPATFFKNLPG